MQDLLGKIENLVREFSIDNLKDFLLTKDKNFIIAQVRLYSYEDINFTEIYKVAEMKLQDKIDLKIFTIKTSGELSERSSKKRQFELAKKILKDLSIGAEAGIFIFYDNEKNFRFSLVYSIFSGTKRNFSYYKRHTYYVARQKPYRTFKKALYTVKFDTLEDIISAFNVIPLTKEFYTEIQNWYAWALKYAWFPGGGKEENLIRLLTRLIFVWFLKERKLIPDKIFDPEFLKDIVLDFGIGSYYYNAILQNLFFATLNRYQKDRDFAEDIDFVVNRKTFGVKMLFRYEKFLKIPKDNFLKIFEKVPFINGGLFECLDDDSNYIDGFSRREDKRAKLPDFLFFAGERLEDLSNFYGEKRKENVKGLINILNDYNFTADESSPIDIEVSLDPELLGHIFENLLAIYNPETKMTARKATGSYYTPKEIVDLMVEESLIEYFKYNTGIEEEKLKDLFSYNEEVGLDKEEREKIIYAIDELKVIDPAVGSGAFPMGIIHKLIHIMSKIDSNNELWYELQYKRALHEFEEILKIGDKQKRENLLKELNDNFDENINYPDYARKLYLIENSIYGVDIQSIAIQICKLRFFLSLLIDQKIDESKENYGIKPLPHLETKFVSANTLVGLNRKKMAFVDYRISKLREELRALYKKYFSIKTREEKKEIQRCAEEIRSRIKEVLIEDSWDDDIVKKITCFDIFNQTASADWFDPEWMFGIESGFDIVIGNPPYGNIIDKYRNKECKTKEFIKNFYKYCSLSDISSPFIEKGINLLRDGGNLSYIITFAITFNKDFSKNRQQMVDTFERINIYTFDRDRCRIFENMSQSVSILMCINKNSREKKGIFTSRMFRETPDMSRIEVTNCDKYLLPKGSKYSQPHRLPKIGEEINRQILDKLLSFDDSISSIIKENGSQIWVRTSGNYWYNAWNRKPYDGSEISFLFIEEKLTNFFILLINSSLFYFWFRIYGDGRHMNMDILENFPLPDKEKIVRYNLLLERMKERLMKRLFLVFDKEHKRFLTSNIKDEIDLVDFVLCVKFYKLEYKEWEYIINYDHEVRGGIKIDKEILSLVDQIFSAKTKDIGADTSAFEKQIDQTIYMFYNLTDKEIEMMEGVQYKV